MRRWPRDLEAVSAQRIDKWLWFARVVKSRSLAARLVEGGHVRINGVRSDNAAKALRPGDVLTVALERHVRVLARRRRRREARTVHRGVASFRGPRRDRAATLRRERPP